MIQFDPIQHLANAIIVQAAEDYREALGGGAPRGKVPEAVISECERFFRSDWFLVLTEMDGEILMEKIRNEVKRRNP